MDIFKSSNNKYGVGTIVSTRRNPAIMLNIVSYLKRIYYCTLVSEPNGKQFAYFENEFMPIEVGTWPLQFSLVNTKPEMIRRSK